MDEAKEQNQRAGKGQDPHFRVKLKMSFEDRGKDLAR
jgi:hypothetical protein